MIRIGEAGVGINTPEEEKAIMQTSFLDPAPLPEDPKAHKLNPDGFSVAGCKYIYAPAGQAGEYSKLATSPYRGCGTKCRYCYVPDVIRMDRRDFDAGAVPRPDYLNHLRRDAKKYQSLGIHEQVMLSFTTDPFNPTDTSLTEETIKILQAHGLGVCTLTKGGTRSLPYLKFFRPSRDAFASTLTSLDDSFSRIWEPEAALPADRIKALQEFHEAGIFTWVSLEPVIDTRASIEIIKETHPIVDLYKIGRANYISITKETNWEAFTHRVIETCAGLGVRHYIKKDLQRYLPAGYHNPVYVDQFHGGNHV